MDTPAITSATEPTPIPSSPSPTILHLVPVEFAEAAWPGPVEALVTAACDRDGLYGPQDVLDWLKRGTHRLWAAGSKENGAEAVAVTELVDHARGRTLNFFILTGQDPDRWFHHIATIEAWAKEQGCDRVTPITRKGWAKRMPAEYRLTHYVWEKRL